MARHRRRPRGRRFAEAIRLAALTTLAAAVPSLASPSPTTRDVQTPASPSEAGVVVVLVVAVIGAVALFLLTRLSGGNTRSGHPASSAGARSERR